MAQSLSRLERILMTNNNSVYVLAPGEDWILDRWTSEWKQFNADITTDDPNAAQVLWILADWCWRKIPIALLEQKKVLVTVQHVVPEKFKGELEREFLERDRYTDVYQVPCEITYNAIRPLTSKPIIVKPHWVNQHLWHPVGSVDALRSKHNLPQSAFLIGSFQRDTEGRDLVSPKLEKGPDIFCEAVESLHKIRPDTEVVLAGWRRQYVMNRLQAAGIRYHYFELPNFETVNELYNALNLYIVGARVEGGPQSIVECAAIGTPIISTDVGVARQFLAPESIFAPGHALEARPNVEHARRTIEPYFMPQGFAPFRELISEMK